MVIDYRHTSQAAKLELSNFFLSFLCSPINLKTTDLSLFISFLLGPAAPSIQKSGCLGSVVSTLRSLTGPKYNGVYLHKLIRKLLGTMRLHDSLTGLVIPTFDIKKLQPVLFSSYEVSSRMYFGQSALVVCV